ncbi:esterase-like [Cornus florida]|uniref:esterase-like n=1 Tax=Cornus florida TaxID=4283 RepID=UPI00289F0944|nr:esterase-like [Cornus florida]
MECLKMIKPAFTLSCFCMLLCYATVLNPVSAKESCDFPAIFNFGESNSDTGALAAVFNWTPPPYGETFFHRPTGRYCDGRLLIDFVASHLGLPFLNAYLNSLGSNFTHGANFASAAATATIPLSNDFVIPAGGYSPFYLNVQVGQFEQFKYRSQIIRKTGGIYKDLMPKEEYFGKALYVIGIGHNDLTERLIANMTIEEVNASIPYIINGVSTNIKNIYQLGGRSFWVQNTNPIGCSPFFLTTFPPTADETDSAGCSKPFNEVLQHYNYKLKEAIVQLRKELPSAAFTFVDAYSLKYRLISEAQKYGFELPLVSCCGYGGKYNFGVVGCGRTATVNGSQIFGGSCKDPSVRVYWDGFHFTDAANKFFIDQLSTGAFSDPPIPLKMACHREFD